MTEVAKLNIEKANYVNIRVTETIVVARDETRQHGISEFGVLENDATCTAGEGE
jgi:hypothetical protein